MPNIQYYNRKTGKLEKENVFGKRAIKLLYGNDILSRILGAPLLRISARFSLFSALYGWWQNRSWTRRKIAPFVHDFGIDSEEFELPLEKFTSFNDFFIRKLKVSCRPIAPGEDKAIIPADGRYLVYPNLEEADGFVVKGKKFDLRTLLDNEDLASDYRKGSMVIARLCPTDYHRFFFPCAGLPSATQLTNGFLYSVNPVALQKNIHIFTQNKRTLCRFETKAFGKVLYLEIGATNVGSITQTYQPNKPQSKGDEKGYFSFGASSLILLFPPRSITFEPDLVQASKQHIETLCLLGSTLGTS